MREEIQRRSLRRENRTRTSGNLRDDAAGLDSFAVAGQDCGADAFLEQPKGEHRDADAGDDAARSRDDLRRRLAVGLDDSLRREVSAAADVFEQSCPNDRLGENTSSSDAAKSREGTLGKGFIRLRIVASIMAAPAFATSQRGLSNQPSDDEEIAQPAVRRCGGRLELADTCERLA